MLVKKQKQKIYREKEGKVDGDLAVRYLVDCLVLWLGLKGSKWGTAIGAGLGSFGGSSLAKATEPGGWALKGVGGIPSLLSSGMFFQTGREKGDIRKADISRSIEEANKSYEQAVYVDALRDALSGYSLASLKPGDWFDQGLEGKVLPDSPISSGYDWNV